MSNLRAIPVISPLFILRRVHQNLVLRAWTGGGIPALSVSRPERHRVIDRREQGHNLLHLTVAIPYLPDLAECARVILIVELKTISWMIPLCAGNSALTVISEKFNLGLKARGFSPEQGHLEPATDTSNLALKGVVLIDVSQDKVAGSFWC